MIPSDRVLGLTETDIWAIREKKANVRKDAVIGIVGGWVIFSIRRIREIVRRRGGIRGSGGGRVDHFRVVISRKRVVAGEGGRQGGIRELMANRVGIVFEVTGKTEVDHVKEVWGQEIKFLSEGVEERSAPLAVDGVMALEHVIVRFLRGQARRAPTIEPGLSTMEAAADG